MHSFHLTIQELLLLAGVASVDVLAQDDVNGCLSRVVTDCVDEEPPHHLGLVVQFADKAFFAVTSDPRNCGVGARVLPA